MGEIRDALKQLIQSDPYIEWAEEHAADALKVSLELGGRRRPDPRGRFPLSIVRLARLDPPVSVPTSTTPLPAGLSALARNVMFTAWDPLAALQAPAHWKVALSADPAYSAAARAAAPKLRERGHLVGAWGNQAQIGAGRLRSFAADIDAAFIIFQAETAVEYESAIAGGANLIVGNVDSWTDAQRTDAIARIGRGFLAVLMECYTNMTGVWPDTASGRGVPVASEVLGVGQWEDKPDLQLGAYHPRTPAGVWATMGVYLAEGMSPASFAALP